MIVDTSYLLALLDRDDAHHATARAWYEAAGPQTVQQTVLAETLAVVRHRARKAGGSALSQREERLALDLIVETFGFDVQPVQDLQQATVLLQEHPALTFVDACGVADARSAGGLWSFDNRQRRLAAATNAVASSTPTSFP